MRLPRITRKKLLIFIIILVIGIPISVFGIMLIALSSMDFKLIGPDCNGLPIHITGLIQNTNRQPIVDAKIRVFTTGPEEELDIEFTSDNSGYFTYTGTRSIFMFACNELVFIVTASGFKDKSVAYSLYEDYTEDQLSTINPNMVSIRITLERAT
jgi:hypothetical protein